ncbi:MAG: flagellar type III secretion system protein FliQ [Candidatus Melainabacteria bacterium]|nr:MAG: flagellar type III secretion system protein FliQ [Candidatus Melainabacteria bacterium]
MQLSAPILVVAVAVGLVISIFQSVTQIQEQTLTFVPKIIACVLVLILTLPWMLNIFIARVNDLFSKIPLMLQ